MQLSAELRWFWEGQCPDKVSDWFGGPEWTTASTSEQYRDDYFLMPGNTEVSCKLRNRSPEDSGESKIKGLIKRFEHNRIELWGKWQWVPPTQAPRVILHKERQLRHFSAFGASYAFRGDEPNDESPDASDAAKQLSDICRIELTRLHVEGFEGLWWTLGLEAWGDLISAPLTLTRALDRLRPPVSGERLLNYPQFLNDLHGRRA